MYIYNKRKTTTLQFENEIIVQYPKTQPRKMTGSALLTFGTKVDFPFPMYSDNQLEVIGLTLERIEKPKKDDE